MKFVKSPHLLDLQRRRKWRPDKEQRDTTQRSQVRNDVRVIAIVQNLGTPQFSAMLGARHHLTDAVLPKRATCSLRAKGICMNRV